jgi:hypothetical protein
MRFFRPSPEAHSLGRLTLTWKEPNWIVWLLIALSGNGAFLVASGRPMLTVLGVGRRTANPLHLIPFHVADET